MWMLGVVVLIYHQWCFRAQSWRVVPLIRLAMLALRLVQVRIRE